MVKDRATIRDTVRGRVKDIVGVMVIVRLWARIGSGLGYYVVMVWF